ncbi:MAG: S8 family serine peptidase [Bacteroidetes bacterium]|nr:S8 family serine peptidase [Bacteroidota bacterium]
MMINLYFRAQWTIVAMVVTTILPALSQEAPNIFEPHFVTVQFERGIQIESGATKTDLFELNDFHETYQVRRIERAFPFLDFVTPTPKTAQNLDALRRTYYVHFGVDADPSQAASDLTDLPGVVFAEPLIIHHLVESETLFDPNDLHYGQQTYLNHMRFPEAWDLVKGIVRSKPTVIAIVDGGANWDHEDLLDHVWTNEDEIPDNKIDDDQNGFIDDIHGINLTNDREGDNNPIPVPDLHHGTAVAGVAGAVTNNNIGIAGAGLNVRLMHINVVCPVLGALGVLYSICRGYEGILYAAANGADIINTSWVGISHTEQQRLNNQVIELATDMGALIVAAAGNSNRNSDEFIIYPASHPRVLSVGATEKDTRKRAQFSNFGQSVQVFAPGIDILGPRTGSEKYDQFQGTSFAAPLVSGLAALIKTAYPQITPDALREQLRLSSEDISGDNPSFEGQLGRGYVNAELSLRPPTLPGVRVSQWAWLNQIGENTIDPGDEVTIRATVTNYLKDADQLTVQMINTPLNPYITLTKSQQSLGALSSGDSKSVEFKFIVDDEALPSSRARFTVRIQDGPFIDTPDQFRFSKINEKLDLLNRALLTFYRSTNGDQWYDNSGWKVDQPVTVSEQYSSWYGIKLQWGQVEGLDLTNNNVTGVIPKELGFAHGLRRLILVENSITGEIPQELGQIRQLRTLNLAANSLSGDIPSELGNLSNLETLYLYFNDLTGEIPPELGQLSNLKELDLTENSLSGTIPEELGQLTQLETLSLSSNQLSGSLPRSLMQLKKLWFLGFKDQNVCAPSDQEFQDWLDQIRFVEGPTCRGLEIAGIIEDLKLVFGQEMIPVTFPIAVGGISPILYGITPILPDGLQFDSSTRILHGTPKVITSSPETYTYAAKDANQMVHSLPFTVSVITASSSNTESLPQTFVIHNNYPNPFHQTTQLSFDLPWSAQIQVEVIDIIGRRVMSLAQQTIEAGWNQSIQLKAEHLSDGVYIYQIIANAPQQQYNQTGSFVKLQ